MPEPADEKIARVAAADDPVELLAGLVAIASVNPSLVPGGSGETEIARACRAWFDARGFETTWLERTPGRPSVVGVRRGAGGGRSLMLNGHIDTVTLAGYDGAPLTHVVRDGRLYGRGAYDMKCGVAAMMVAAARATARPLAGDVLVCCVADEEYASIGTAEVLDRFTADAGIVTEPMGLRPCCDHKGFAWFEITVHGRAAHGSRPELGIDAIVLAGHVLVGIGAIAARLDASPGHPTLGPGSIHASIISGGEEASSYPAECRITIERRTVPGETAESVRDELVSLLDGIARRIPAFRYDLEMTLVRHPLHTSFDSAIARSVMTAAKTSLGHAPEPRYEPFWTDASLLDQAGIPSLLFGPDGGGAHAATEWADIASVSATCDVLEAVIRDFCGSPG